MNKKPDPKTPVYIESIGAPRTVSVYAYRIVLMLVNQLAWVIMSVIIKYLGDIYLTAQLLFFRNSVPVPVMLVLVLMAGGVSPFKTCGADIHILHAVVDIKC